MSNAQNQVKAIPGLKKNAITEEYKVTNQVLGMGINGRVLEVFQKSNGQKCALKVINLLYFVTVTGYSLCWVYLWAPPFLHACRKSGLKCIQVFAHIPNWWMSSLCWVSRRNNALLCLSTKYAMNAPNKCLWGGTGNNMIMWFFFSL